MILCTYLFHFIFATVLKNCNHQRCSNGFSYRIAPFTRANNEMVLHKFGRFKIFTSYVKRVVTY